MLILSSLLLFIAVVSTAVQTYRENRDFERYFHG